MGRSYCCVCVNFFANEEKRMKESDWKGKRNSPPDTSRVEM